VLGEQNAPTTTVQAGDFFSFTDSQAILDFGCDVTSFTLPSLPLYDSLLFFLNSDTRDEFRKSHQWAYTEAQLADGEIVEKILLSRLNGSKISICFRNQIFELDSVVVGKQFPTNNKPPLLIGRDVINVLNR